MNLICMLIVWILSGIISVLILYDLYYIVKNPLWEPVIILFGAVSLLVTLIIVVIGGIKNWINEVNKYYRNRKRK